MYMQPTENWESNTVKRGPSLVFSVKQYQISSSKMKISGKSANYFLKKKKQSTVPNIHKHIKFTKYTIQNLITLNICC